MPLITKRAHITDLLTQAVAEATGLKPEQIETITANSDQIQIGYTGPQPGMGGGIGRHATQVWNTTTGQLITDGPDWESPLAKTKTCPACTGTGQKTETQS
jgi:hypothetical protein